MAEQPPHISGRRLSLVVFLTSPRLVGRNKKPPPNLVAVVDIPRNTKSTVPWNCMKGPRNELRTHENPLGKGIKDKRKESCIQKTGAVEDKVAGGRLCSGTAREAVEGSRSKRRLRVKWMWTSLKRKEWGR